MPVSANIFILAASVAGEKVDLLVSGFWTSVFGRAINRQMHNKKIDFMAFVFSGYKFISI